MGDLDSGDFGTVQSGDEDRMIDFFTDDLLMDYDILLSDQQADTARSNPAAQRCSNVILRDGSMPVPSSSGEQSIGLGSESAGTGGRRPDGSHLTKQDRVRERNRTASARFREKQKVLLAINSTAPCNDGWLRARPLQDDILSKRSKQVTHSYLNRLAALKGVSFPILMR
jgi:hypothetical protein